MNIFPPRSPQVQILLILILLVVLIFEHTKRKPTQSRAISNSGPVTESNLKLYKGFENSDSKESKESAELIKELANTLINSKL